MQRYTVLSTILLIGVSVAFASDPSTTPRQETAGQVTPTAPADVTAAPTTRPTAATTAPTVLVLPFEQIGAALGYDWIGRAVQQNLVAELTRTRPRMTPIAPAPGAASPADTDAAVNAGKSAGADFVVYGSYQLNDQDLRFTGQVVSVATGNPVGSLKSTGTVRDLFALEDTLAMQAKRLLAPTQPAPAGAAAAYMPAPLPLAIPATQPAAAGATAPATPPTAPSAFAPRPSTYDRTAGYNRYTYYPSQYPYYSYPYYGGYYRYPYSYYYPYYGGYSTGHLQTITRTVRPAPFVGKSMVPVAGGMISVPGAFMPNGELAR